MAHSGLVYKLLVLVALTRRVWLQNSGRLILLYLRLIYRFRQLRIAKRLIYDDSRQVFDVVLLLVKVLS